jgi:phosphinothricin acetyltransferase
MSAPPSQHRVRPSRADDLGEIQAIYAHHVRHGLASFEEEPPDLAEMQRRRTAVLAGNLPHLVAELDGRVAGFATAVPYRHRPAYRYTLENTVYVAEWAQRHGLGRALLERLIDDCKALGYRQMIAVIGDSANLASIGLHEALGFRRVGVLLDVGFKFERWVDSVLLQLPLAETPQRPPD